MKKNKKQKLNSLKVQRISFFKPIKLHTNRSVRTIQKRQLTWPQASIRFPRLKAFGDADHDGILNAWDCRPFDRKRHSKIFRKDIERNISIENISEERLDKLRRKIPALTAKKKPLYYKQITEDEDIILSYPDEKRIKTIKMIENRIHKPLYKTITKDDVITYFEKNPDQYRKQLQLQRIMTQRGADPVIKIVPNRKESLGQAIAAYDDGGLIRIPSIQRMRSDIGESIEHEQFHGDQDIEGISKELDRLSKRKKWEDKPVEKDVFNRQETYELVPVRIQIKTDKKLENRNIDKVNPKWPTRDRPELLEKFDESQIEDISPIPDPDIIPEQNKSDWDEENEEK